MRGDKVLKLKNTCEHLEAAASCLHNAQVGLASFHDSFTPDSVESEPAFLLKWQLLYETGSQTLLSNYPEGAIREAKDQLRASVSTEAET